MQLNMLPKSTRFVTYSTLDLHFFNKYFLLIFFFLYLSFEKDPGQFKHEGQGCLQTLEIQKGDRRRVRKGNCPLWLSDTRVKILWPSYYIHIWRLIAGNCGNHFQLLLLRQWHRSPGDRQSFPWTLNVMSQYEFLQPIHDFCWFIAVNCCINTHRLYIIANMTPFNQKLIADWLLSPSWSTEIWLKVAVVADLSSKQPFQRWWDHN